MSEVKEFFRICPSCGRRFHIKLVTKKLVDNRKEEGVIKQNVAFQSASAAVGFGRMTMFPIVVTESVPVTVDIEDFQFSYKCGHCGHVWSEMRVEESKT
jgi:DNA-directed RNA polymerase subunit RPC12/RpoP